MSLPNPPLALTLPLRGRQLIEASAGTGKTFTIALLYVRLILGQRNPASHQEPSDANRCAGEALLPPDILVMTFTDAATEELRGRIRERLVEAAQVFRTPSESEDAGASSDDPLIALRSSFAPADWPRLARRLQLAAEWMDDAAVSTIHGWCNRMLREHAFDSANLFHQTLITDLNDLQREAIIDYWRTRFYPLDTLQATAVRAQYTSPAALLDDLRDLLKRDTAQLQFAGQPMDADELPEVLGKLAAAAAAGEKAEEDARRCYLENGSEIKQMIVDLRPVMNGTTFKNVKDDETFARWLDELEQWSHGRPADKFVPRLGRSRLKLKAKAEVPDHLFFDLVDHWQNLAAYAAEAGPRLKAVIRADAARWVSDRLQQQLLSRAELGYDDLLRRLDAALQGAQGDALAQRIRDQFPVALIDEFQDTDPLQYRIFSRVYDGGAADVTSLVLIGDPKQAIYSFRGADIHTYLAAQQSTPVHQRHTLDTNFRSTKGMVDAVNQLFSRAESHTLGAFRFGGEGSPLQFHAVKAKGRREVLELDGDTPAPFTAWLCEHATTIGTTACRELMAEQAAEQIAGWLNGAAAGRSGFRDGAQWQPLKPRDVAILVKDFKEANCVRTALQRHGLTSVYLSDRDSVFNSPEALDLLTWLKACAEPNDDRLVQAALGTATLDLPLAQLDQLQHDELAWERLQERFADYHQRWRRQGVLPMLRRLLHDFDLPRHHLDLEGGQRRVTNLLHLAEWAQQTSDALDGEQALIRSLAHHIQQPTGEEQILRLESDAELIQIVTIHKSKGLEYPVALLPFAYSWREPKNLQAIYQSEDGLRVELSKPQSAPEAYARADAERLGEDLRLFYVALTRARHAVFVGAAPLAPGNNKHAQLHKGALGYLLAGGEPIEDAATLRTRLQELIGDSKLMAISPIAADIGATLYQPPADGRIFRAAREPGHAPFTLWWVASYSALEARRSATAGPDQALPVPETARDETRGEEFQQAAFGGHPTTVGMPQTGTIHKFPRGPEPGTFLHGLLEWAGHQGFKRMVTPADANELETHIQTQWLPQIERRAQTRGWQQHSNMLGQWLHRVLTTPLPLSELSEQPAATGKATLTLCELQAYRVEEEFWFSARQVDAEVLDALITRHLLPGQPRAPLDQRRLNGLLKGFIDLVAAHDGRYYVMDWKSNYLGADTSAYTDTTLEEAMLAKRYDVQLSLYLLALHRHLRRVMPNYRYEQHVGGGLLVFLRGIEAPGRGMCHALPSLEFITALDDLFAGRPGDQRDHQHQLLPAGNH